jgi:hypothetical protein
MIDFYLPQGTVRYTLTQHLGLFTWIDEDTTKWGKVDEKEQKTQWKMTNNEVKMRCRWSYVDAIQCH